MAHVSIHTRHHWRVKRAIAPARLRVGIVSIHTRHHWRVKRGRRSPSRSTRLFQSTPAITGG